MKFEIKKWWKKCREERTGFCNLFVCIPHVLDYIFRIADFNFHCIYPDTNRVPELSGNLISRVLSSPAYFYKKISTKLCKNVSTHSPVAYIVPLFLFYFIIYGPTLSWRGFLPFFILFFTVFLFLILMCKLHEKWVFVVQWGIISGLCLLVWLIAKPDATENSVEMYRHLLIPVISVLITVGMPLSRFMSHAVLYTFKKQEENKNTAYLRPRVKYTELFVSPEFPTVTGWQIVRALLTVPLYHPLELFYFSTIPLYWVDDRSLMWVMYWVFLGIGVFLLWVTGLHNRFKSFFNMLNRVLFVGGQLVVSLFIIIIAYARLADFGYVSTLVESLSGEVLLFYFLSAYIIFWTYEYWINRSLSERILPLFVPLKNIAQPGIKSGATPGLLKGVFCDYFKDVFGRSGNGRRGQGPYEIEKGIKSTHIKEDGRVLQIHAGARFVVVGKKDDKKLENRFHLYDRMELFRRVIFEHKTLNGKGGVFNTTQDQKKRNKENAQFSDIQKRIRFYFVFLNVALVAGAYFSWLYLSHLDQVPAVIAEEITDDHLTVDKNLVDLQKNLFGSENSAPAKQVIAMSFSGGGTRAALYVSAVLRGLEDIGVLKDVVLTSGVSGGGTGLAYFASHRSELVTNTADQPVNQDAWQCFYTTMSAPFIQDVIEGAAEWRIMKGTRLGMLLDESFGNRFYDYNENDHCNTSDKQVIKIGEINGQDKTQVRKNSLKDLAVIFNTTVSGHPYYDSWRYGKFEENKEIDSIKYSSNISSGTRLILTNLSDLSGFPVINMKPEEQLVGKNPRQTFSLQARDQVLKYVAVNDPQVKLSTAAALNANFPPVFSDAAVDIKPSDNPERKDRYWVTDGGATDNRGIISLLLALKQSLNKQCEVACKESDENKRALPIIHIVVAEASASSVDYAPSRGIGAKFGAAAHFADQLTAELLTDITALYTKLGGKPENIQLHYLTMPSVFSVRGGLGTHWMLQENINFVPSDNPIKSKAEDEKIHLPGTVVKGIIEHLYQRDPTRADYIKSLKKKSHQEKAKKVWEWIGHDNADEVWVNFCKQVIKDNKDKTCSEYLVR